MRATTVALVIAVALAVPSQSARTQSVNMRKTVARAIIAGSHRLYDGNFNAGGTSSVCGELPKEMSFTGVATFVVEFPSDELPNAGIQSIAFGSSQLVGKVTRASVFRLKVNVRTANGGRPPAYVLNTDSGKPKNAGTATLTKNKGGSLTLRVVGQNDMGEVINLTITCT
jgi:hypothetical protein